METLVIATDLSDASRKVLLYGIQFAESLNAKIVLLNVCSVLAHNSDRPHLINERVLVDNYRSQLNDYVAGLQYDGRVLIEQRVETGFAAEVIVKVAIQENASWIVAGINGHTKFNPLVFGGTAVSLARQSPVPVLLVPEEANGGVPVHIMLAADLSVQIHPGLFEPVVAACKSLNATLQLVYIRAGGSPTLNQAETISADMQKYVKDAQPPADFSDYTDAVNGMGEMMKLNQVDVIALVPGEHSLFEQILSKSATRKMIVGWNVPLMILPGKNAPAAKVKCKRDETCQKCPACRRKSFLAQAGDHGHHDEHQHEHTDEHEHAHKH